MRTGNDVFRRAISLLGYTGADGAVNGAQSAELFRRGLNIVNQVMADIWPLERKDAYIPLSNINDDIPLSQYAVESTMLYGVAMFLAQSEGDGENQQFSSSLYQQQRNAVQCADKPAFGQIEACDKERYHKHAKHCKLVWKVHFCFSVTVLRVVPITA